MKQRKGAGEIGVGPALEEQAGGLIRAQPEHTSRPEH